MNVSSKCGGGESQRRAGCSRMGNAGGPEPQWSLRWRGCATPLWRRLQGVELIYESRTTEHDTCMKTRQFKQLASKGFDARLPLLIEGLETIAANVSRIT